MIMLVEWEALQAELQRERLRSAQLEGQIMILREWLQRAEGRAVSAGPGEYPAPWFGPPDAAPEHVPGIVEITCGSPTRPDGERR